MGIRILVVEGESQLRLLMGRLLRNADMISISASTSAEAAEILSSSHPDAVLLDLALPDAAGLPLLRRIRLLYAGPIIVVSSDGRKSVKIGCLNAGADDFIAKPFDVAEVAARIQAAVRRYLRGMRTFAVVRVADLEVDLNHHKVHLAGAPLNLNAREYAVLSSLAQAVGSAVSYSMLAARISIPDDPSGIRYISSTMYSIRRKLRDNAVFDYEYIKTIPKFGYSLSI